MRECVKWWLDLEETVHYAGDETDPLFDESIIDKYDTSSLATAPGKSDNWLEAQGDDLDPFINAIANALIRDGKPKSQAIAIAIGTVKRWARGGGNVNADTRAKAVKALAAWEKSKAKAKARRTR
jgi:hypothetical protein